MTTSKAIQIAKDIEDARCKGNWKLMPELARRYRKHNPKGEVLAQTIVAEASLAQLVQNTQSSSSSSLLNADQVKSIRHQLQSVIHMTDTATATDREFAKVVLARSYYACGDFTKAVDIVSHLSFERQDVNAGYNAVLLLQARVMKAVGFEHMGDMPLAFDTYRSVTMVVKDALTAKERVLVEWAEEGLYRGAMVAWKYEGADVGSTLEMLRAYQRVTASQPLAWRQSKRIKMAEQSLRYLCNVYRKGEYCPPERSGTKQAMFVIEVTQLHALYEKMILSVAKFPRANQVNQPILDYADLVWEIVETPSVATWSVNDLRGFTEGLNRATQKAFNSPRITRHLFHVQYMTGDYKQAHHALQAYLYMVGLVSHARNASRDHGEALAIDSRGNTRPVPAIKKEDIRQLVQESAGGELADMHNAAKPTKSIASRRTVEKESTQDTLKVLLAGIKMLCQDLENGPEAVELGEIASAVFNLQSEGFQQEHKVLGANVYRATGTAYGLLANQTTDPPTRSQYHSEALKFLQESTAMDPDAWQTYYQLALQQGTMRDVHLAIQTITKALQMNPDHIPSWHLLVLACSCPSQGGLEQSLRTCQMSLDRIQQSDDLPEDGSSNNSDQDGGDDQQPQDLGSRPGFDRLEQRVLLQMTQSMLLNVARGAQDALESQKGVFSTYGQIAIPEEMDEGTGGLYQSNGNNVNAGSRNPMVVSGSLGNLSESVSGGIAAQESAPVITNGKATTNGVTRGSTWHTNGSSTSSSNGSDDTIRTAPTPLGASSSSHHHRGRLHPSLHLFRSKSKLRKQHPEKVNGSTTTTTTNDSTTRGSYPMQASVSSLHSAVPSLSSTASIIPHGSVGSATMDAQPTARCRLRQRRSIRILCNLWLLSASCFLELGLVNETLKAIEEAENVDWTNNAGVWCMLGRLRLVENKIDSAIAAFQKGLVCDGNDVECRVWLAKAYIQHGDLEVAEGLLEFVTRSNGWNCTEAWLYLGQVYRKTDRLERAKDCFIYALELERTQPIQPFSILPRCI